MKLDDKLMIATGILIMLLGLNTRETAELWLKALYMINLGILLRTVYRAGKASMMRQFEALRQSMRGDAEEIRRLQGELYEIKEQMNERTSDRRDGAP